MLKLLSAAVLVGMMSVPAMAMDATCDEASMMKMQGDMDAMSDPAMKDAAMKHMDMAKDAMKANKMDDCMMHMNEAMEGMKKS